ncbi:MAG TPA: methylmalonyl-CoA epimerase [Gaiellaceae bacterium]|nr:methylmalonyl-CoA epimerase [Gaiellaceae bacterium]
MPVKGIHHVGVAVEDLEESLAMYSALFGAQLEHREELADQGVDSISLRVGDSRVELLGSLGPDTPVGKFLDRRGPGLHHVAFEVDDIAAELERLAAAGAELIDEAPRRGILGSQVAFVHPHATGGVLAELVTSG